MFLALLLLGYAGAIDEPQAVVASFVSVGKCGSSTMRAMLAVEYHGYKVCGISTNHSQKMANKFRALGGDVTLLDQWVKGLQPESGCQILLAYGYAGPPGECGGGSNLTRSAHASGSTAIATTLKYFTLLREPIARAVSEYNYFCLDCKEDRKFCEEGKIGHDSSMVWRGRNNMCPHITFLEWVRRRSNQYTRHFERRWPLKQCQIEDVDLRVQATPKPARPGVSYYREYHRGWNMSTTDQQYKRALANLKSPNMHVVWLETLDHGGWRMLEDYLNASGVVPWISTARRKSGGVCASGSLSACATNMTVHANMNANRRRRRGTQGGHHYDPTDAERAEAVRINHHDVALHAALTKGLNLETSVPTPTPTRSSGSGSGGSYTDAENGEFFLDSKAGPKRGSKRIDFKGDGSVGFIQTNKGGLSKKFRISLADAANIANDKPWKDTEGNEIKAGKGGQLTKIDGTWYWIGTDPNNAGHLHLYSSETLGDGTWKWRGQVAEEVENDWAANCKLAKHPNNYYIIVCKGQVFFKSDTVDGWYDSTNPQNVQKYVKRPTFANGEPIEGLYTHKFGGGSLFIDDDGESAYYIASRKNLEVEKAQKVNPNVYKDDRNVGIYKLNEEWTDYEEENAEVYWNPNIGREAMFLFKRNNRYYMTASHTGKWKPSDTYIKTATRQDFLDGQWSPEKQLEFVPAKIHNDKSPRDSVKSHGCQQRYLVDLGDDRWMFGGDRYPVEGYDTVWYPKYGRHIRMPVVWRNETVVWSDDKVPMPTVYWRSVWNVGAYDYTNTKSEKHDPVPGVNDCPTKCFHLHL